MVKKLIIVAERIAGTTTPDDINGYHLIDPPAGFSGDLRELAYDAATDTAIISLAPLREAMIAGIRQRAAEAINALAWRIERAQERDRLGLPGETVEQVMLDREALRRASNRCEAAIHAALTADDVCAVEYAVLAEDRPTPQRVTNLKFIDRFTDAEMQGLLVASDQYPALQAAMLKWQAADGIVLTDPATQAGVQALEMLGLIGAGRAAEILAC